MCNALHLILLRWTTFPPTWRNCFNDNCPLVMVIITAFFQFYWAKWLRIQSEPKEIVPHFSYKNPVERIEWFLIFWKSKSMSYVLHLTVFVQVYLCNRPQPLKKSSLIYCYFIVCCLFVKYSTQINEISNVGALFPSDTIVEFGYKQKVAPPAHHRCFIFNAHSGKKLLDPNIYPHPRSTHCTAKRSSFPTRERNRTSHLPHRPSTVLY